MAKQGVAARQVVAVRQGVTVRQGAAADREGRNTRTPKQTGSQEHCKQTGRQENS
jgi:hypothetical protein